MIHSFVFQRVVVAYVNTGLAPINQSFTLVLVCRVELRLCTQPKFVRVKKLNPSLHIVENGIVDV